MRKTSRRTRQEMALALFVSLWIAGGGVAWAEEVTVSNGERVEYISCSGDENIITVESGGQVTGKGGADAGASITGGVNNNQLTIAGTVNKRINGGYSDWNDVTGNHVTISGLAKDYVYGGRSAARAVKNNHVALLTGGTVNECLSGGKSNGGIVEKNTVTIAGGTVQNAVYGAQSTAGDALENEAHIQSGTVTQDVYGGFTNANEKKASGNVVTISGGTVGGSGSGVYGGYSSKGQATGNKVTITGGTVSDNVYGGKSNNGSAVDNTVTITGGTVGAEFKIVYGGEGETGASGNKVTISGGTINGGVSGGESSNGDATGNEVHIQDVTIEGQVYGGYTGPNGGDATGNTVTLTRSTVNGSVNGGETATSKATGNTIKMTDSNVTGTYAGVYGGSAGGDCTTGNTLHLSGANTVGWNVENFATIKLMDSLAWDITKTVLTAKEFINYGTLDITAATALANQTEPGTMTLLSSGTDNNFNALKLAYSAATQTNPVTFSSTKTSQVVKSEAKTSTEGGVTLGYNNTHTVKLDDIGGNTKNAVTYNITNNVNKLTLGDIAWEANSTVRDGTGYAFSALTASDIVTSAFKLTFADDAKYQSMLKDSQMTLISNATGLEGFNKSGINVVTDHTVANGAKLEAKVNTDVFMQPSKVVLQTNEVRVEKVDLSGWDSSKDAFAIPDSWKNPVASNGSVKAVSVKAEGFTAPTIAAGGQKEILTAPGTFFFDNDITGALKYKEYASSSDTVSGVTLTGSESKGVKASNNNKSLIYARSNFNVKDISLGAMSWNEGRTADTSYDFTNTATIDATKLAFTFTDDQKGALSSSSNMTLLSGATNLAADKTVTKANHTQTIDYAVANGAALSGTLAGTVSTTAGTVKYDATGMTLNSVDITGWDGSSTSEVPAGWAAKTGGVFVTAGSTFAPNVAVGSEKNILTATAGYFSNANIASALQYKPTANSTDTDKGVSLTGSEDKGVKVSTDGKDLIYARGMFNVKNISFGTMSNEGRTASAGYIYAGATIDASKLAFEHPENITHGEYTLLRANNTLGSFDETTKNISYGYTVGGVTINGLIEGSYKKSSNDINYSAVRNKATKLTFGNVEWKDSGALINHATDTTKNINFDGATVDTSNINFTNISEMEDNKQMTLVSDFGTAVGTITGSKYKVNSILQGEGHAFYQSNNLLYLVTKGVNGTANVTGNTEEIKDGKTVEGDVIGAATLSGTAESNKANVSGESKVKGNVVGATTESGPATSNTAHVESSTVTGNVEAAHTDSGVAIGNQANVMGGSVGGDVAGAISNSGTVSNGNTAAVKAAVVDGNVYGGKSNAGEVNTNMANVSGGTVKGSVYGGRTDGAKKADGNKAALAGSVKVEGDVYGGYSGQGTATANTVTVDGAEIAGTVYGGISRDKSDNNTVEMDSGTVGTIIGGACEEASGNTVIITGGEVLNGVYGAKAGTSATGNNVTMSGGKVNGVLYGGYTDSTEGITTGNTVTLYDLADVSNASLYGGSNVATGNVLNIGVLLDDTLHAWTGGGQSVKNVANFATIHFAVVPWSTDKAALTITDGSSSNLASAAVTAEHIHFTNTEALRGGDTMTLLDESTVTKARQVQAENLVTSSTYTIGTSTQGTGTLSLDDSGNVIYTVTDKNASDQSHSTVMGAEVGMAALSAGNEFVGAAVEGISLASNTGNDGVAVYANMGGGSTRQETGSHIDVRSWNAILAVGHRNAKEKGSFDYGAFFEYGRGNYTTVNGAERGDGSTHYTGGGLLAKYKAKSGTYVEGSLRAGSITDNANNVLRDALGNAYSYKTSAPYYGFHLGVGKEIDLGTDSILDIYGKYFYNRRDSVSFNAGGAYDLDAVTSQILRIGARYTMKRESWNYYGGLAYEYELDGKATGRANGLAIRAASTKGGSLRAELGATFRPSEDSPWNIDLNLSGFAGKKQGISGGVSVAYMF